MKKLVIFDMDGTILDILEDLTDATNYALGQHGLPLRTIEEVRGFVGNGLRKLAERATQGSETAPELVDAVFQTLLSYYKQHCRHKTKPYPGVVELMRQLKKQGYLVAVVSNKADKAVQELCQCFFTNVFDYAVGERSGVRKKPAPDSVLATMEALRADTAIYVGDSEVDLKTAQNAGIPCIAVTWGFRSEEFLLKCGAKHIAHNMMELQIKLMKIS